MTDHVLAHDPAHLDPPRASASQEDAGGTPPQSVFATLLADEGIVWTQGAWMRLADPNAFFEDVACECTAHEVRDVLPSAVRAFGAGGSLADEEPVEEALRLAAEAAADVLLDLAWVTLPDSYGTVRGAIQGIRDRVLRGHLTDRDPETESVYFILRAGDDNYQIQVTTVRDPDDVGVLARVRATALDVDPVATMRVSGGPEAWHMEIEEHGGFERTLKFSPHRGRKKAGGTKEWKIADSVGPVYSPLLPDHFMIPSEGRRSATRSLWGHRCSVSI